MMRESYFVRFRTAPILTPRPDVRDDARVGKLANASARRAFNGVLVATVLAVAIPSRVPVNASGSVLQRHVLSVETAGEASNFESQALFDPAELQKHWTSAMSVISAQGQNTSEVVERAGRVLSAWKEQPSNDYPLEEPEDDELT